MTTTINFNDAVLEGLPLTDYTPTVYNGMTNVNTTSTTITFSKYLRFGDLVLWLLRTDGNSVSSASGESEIIVEAPIPAKNNSTPFAGAVTVEGAGIDIESGGIYDATIGDAISLCICWSPIYTGSRRVSALILYEAS